MIRRILSILLLATTPLLGFVEANGVRLWYETFGDPESEPLLLSAGGLCQGTLWPEPLCQQLAETGFFVIRYDYRDAGLSTAVDFDVAPYDVLDMATDAVGLLDALGIQQAHVAGFSLGGLVSQLMAAHFPDRVKSLTLIATTCHFGPVNRALAGLPPEEGDLSSPRPHYLAMMDDFGNRPIHTRQEAVAQRVDAWQLLNGSVFPLDRATQLALHGLFLDRLLHPASLANHIKAQALSEQLAREAAPLIHTPTLIIHGSEDPIFGPDHAEALHAAIPHSTLLWVAGLGHVPNPHFFPIWVEEISHLASTP